MLFFLHGTGANGKSVFVNTLVGIWHDYAVTIGNRHADGVQHRPAPDRDCPAARRRALPSAARSRSASTWAESKIKTLTGGDRLQGRFMRQDFFEFDPQFKLMIIGNNKPSLRGVDEAIRRRLHLIPFTVTIPPAERDPDLPEKLKAEWPAILRWCFDGCLDGSGSGSTRPSACGRPPTTISPARTRSSAGATTAPTSDTHSWESSGDLWASWKAWAERTGEIRASSEHSASCLRSVGLRPKSKAKPALAATEA